MSRSWSVGLLEAVVARMFALRARFTRARATHAVGVSLPGRLRLSGPVAVELGLPPGEHECAVRFSNLRASHDDAWDVRGAAIRCTDLDLDLLFNTGEGLLFWNGWTLVAFTLANGLGPFGLGMYFRLLPRALRNLHAGVCRGRSYAEFAYHTQVPATVELADGPALVRLRLGLPHPITPPGAAWRYDRPVNPAAPANGLREGTLGGTLPLSVQVRRGPHPREAFDAAEPWDAPWHELGSLAFGTAAGGAGAASPGESPPMSPARMPDFWSAGDARGWGDPRSVAVIREVVYRASRRARGSIE